MTEHPSSMVELDEAPPELVLAAGGLVVRRAGSGSIEVAVVHRPLREDWSFPKGKVEPKETLTDCALREVLEETGLRCRIVTFVGTTEYRDRKGRPKIVAYWAMMAEGGTFRTSTEVDELRWVELGQQAAELLTYDRDRELLSSLDDPSPWILRQLRRSA